MTQPLSTKLKLAIVASFLLLIGAAVLVAAFLSTTPARKPILYEGKALEAWFYGSRTNFFLGEIRPAQKAFDSLGSNAFPFLLGNLKQARGDGTLYFNAYRALPK